jgi:hypothetical protein
MILLSQIPLGIDVESKRKGSFEIDFSLFCGTDRKVRAGWGGVRKSEIK